VTRRRGPAIAAAIAAFGALVVGATASTAAPERSSAMPAGYTGVEAKLPTSYARPVKKPGTNCTIGFQNPIAANETLTFWQRAVVAQGKALGCKVITVDDALSPDKQVSNMQQLLAQKVDAIIFYPIDPKATVPVLKQAKARGVPVIATDGTFGSPKATAPYLPYLATQVWQGRDVQAYVQAQALAKAKPGAKVGLIGIGIPVPALKYLNQREAFWAKKNGLSVVGSQDNPSDDVTGGEKAANGLLQRYSDMDAVIGYNDPSALGAYTASRGVGRKLTIVGLNGSSDGISGVRSGRIQATVQVDAVGWGSQEVLAAYNLITKQNLPLPKIIVRPPRLITKANLGSVPSWAQQVKAIK
jgi:ABC-type sugar transport system substrate-binding protein